MFGGLRLAPSVRVALDRRCSGACEKCGLEWRWALYVSRVDEAGPCTAANMLVLCGTCSPGYDRQQTPFVGRRTPRDRMLTASNRTTGDQPLAASRRPACIQPRRVTCDGDDAQ